jgi:hypothetical protein
VFAPDATNNPGYCGTIGQLNLPETQGFDHSNDQYIHPPVVRQCAVHLNFLSVNQNHQIAKTYYTFGKKTPGYLLATGHRLQTLFSNLTPVEENLMRCQ